MSGICAKNIHPLCALVAYAIVTALVFGGLLSSGFSMFTFVAVPECMSGTTSKPHPSSTTPYIAPSGKEKPFCTKDALANAVIIPYRSFGYLGLSVGLTDVFTAISTMSSTPYCFKRSNGTCPNWEAEGLTSTTATYGAGQFIWSDPSKILKIVCQGSIRGRSFIDCQGSSVVNYNNWPVKLGPANVPAGVDASKTYYLRNVGQTGFSIADGTSSSVLTLTAPAAPNADIPVTLQQFAFCPSQTNVEMPSDPNQESNVKEDGTLKTGSCRLLPDAAANDRLARRPWPLRRHHLPAPCSADHDVDTRPS